jgi:hypothetical protein
LRDKIGFGLVCGGGDHKLVVLVVVVKKKRKKKIHRESERKKKIRRESDEELVDGDRERRLFNLSYVASVLYTRFSNPTFNHRS